ncbi:MAG TPA: hypothetical protein PK493_10495, partial [Pseudomonadota bacterium]|nr:hypothetical protein [Pseudomonadota bacterium]
IDSITLRTRLLTELIPSWFTSGRKMKIVSYSRFVPGSSRMDVWAITFLLADKALGRAEGEDKTGNKKHNFLRPVKRNFAKSLGFARWDQSDPLLRPSPLCRFMA